MIKLIILCTIVLGAGSCAGVKYDKTSSRYRECTRNYPHNPSACDKYRQAHQENVQSIIRTPDMQDADGVLYER